ncbi:MAG: hypothetical protein ACFCVC_13910 [Acidimicrobiia bacterium]
MSDARLRELATRLVAMTPPSPPPPSTRRMPPPRRPLIAVAAAGAVVAAIGIPAVLLGGGDAPPLDQTTLNTTTLETTGTTTDLDLNIVTTLAPAEPGSRIGLPFFDGSQRGVSFSMYRLDDPSGEPLYLLDGPDTWRDLSAPGESGAVDTDARIGAGVDTVQIPDIAQPGAHAICDSGRCFAIDIVDFAADVLALLPPVAPGDTVELPVEGTNPVEWTISRATAPDAIEAVLVSAHDGNPPTVAGYTDTWVPSGVTVEGVQLVTVPADITGPVLVCRQDGSACFWFEIDPGQPIVDETVPPSVVNPDDITTTETIPVPVDGTDRTTELLVSSGESECVVVEGNCIMITAGEPIAPWSTSEYRPGFLEKCAYGLIAQDVARVELRLTSDQGELVVDAPIHVVDAGQRLYAYCWSTQILDRVTAFDADGAVLREIRNGGP